MQRSPSWKQTTAVPMLEARIDAVIGVDMRWGGTGRLSGRHGEWVVEIDRPKRPRGRNGAKSDALDAIRAGREALARDHLATHASAGIGRRSGCCTPPAPPLWLPARTPAGSSRP